MKPAHKSTTEPLAVTTTPIEEVEYTSIIPDDINANRGTVRGRFQLEASLRQHGFLEAGTLDKNNRLIGGNKRTEVAHEIGLGNPLIIDIKGDRPVYLRRLDLDLDSPQGRGAALSLNRTAQTSIDLDPAVVLLYQEMQVDLSDLYFPEELADMLKGLEALGAQPSNDVPPVNTGENDQESTIVPERFLVIVTCTSDPQQAELLERLTGEGFEVRALVS